jgi:NAD(P)-dependent dehydrogenase (short-subunit alcohol dehydrogenase family)
MKIILIGANGTIGELVQKALAGAGHEIVKVGRKSGDFQVEIENRESVRKLYQAVGSFDAVAIAAGEIAFAPLSELTAEKWQFSLGSKLMGQINLVQEAIPFIKEKGSFTLISGVLNDDPIFAGVAASTVSGALEGFVRAAARRHNELRHRLSPRSGRATINGARRATCRRGSSTPAATNVT